jgi:transposase-like protein
MITQRIFRTFRIDGFFYSDGRSDEMDEEKDAGMGQVIRIDEARIRDHLGEMVRGTVEEALNAMLDAEADQLCGAGRYERSEGRQDTRAGSYERALHTKAGEVKLKVPKLRRQTFETAIIERYRRRESSVEEALIEMYLAGVSVRRVEDITEALWGTRVSPGTVSNLNKKIYVKIEEWRNRPIEGEHPYLYLDGIVMKRTWAGEVRNVSLLVASAVNSEGYREILGICEGAKEDKSGWAAFLRHLVDRGLCGVQLIISDACRGLIESIADYLPDARWQRCMVHFYRNVFSHVPTTKVREISHMLKAIHAQESREAAQEKAAAVIDELRRQKLGKAADLVEAHIDETLSYYSFPDSHWLKIRTNNPLERIMKEIRRRTRVVGAFPDGQSCLNLAAARLRHIAGSQWSTRKYMNMAPLYAEQTSTHGAVA